MKVLTACIFTAILISISVHVRAQENNTGIQGKISTENHGPAELATVILLASDSSILKKTTCDNNGVFNFTGLEPGNYLLLASKIGYSQSLNGPYKVTTGAAVNADILLMISLPQLKEVAITAQRDYVEVKPGKVILNVQSSIIAEGNSAYDILRQAPGVKMDNSNNISIIGRQNALITIDGKPTNFTGEDLAGYLQGMPSGSIQQIELITNPSAKYEASGGGIINIISKKGTNIGTNGSLSAGLGYGNFYKSNAGIVFNSRSEKVNVYGNFSFTGDKIYHTFTTNRGINFNGVISNYDADYYTTQAKYYNSFRIGTDYYITDKQTIGIVAYGSVNNNDFVKSNTLKIANNGVPDSTITANSKLERNISNVTYDLNYTGILDKDGKTLSADILYNDITRHSKEYIANNFYDAAGNIYRQPLYQQNLSPSDIHNWVAKVDYTNPMSKTSKMEAGFKYSSVKSNNNLVFGPYENGQYQSDPNFSNTFMYTENISSGYVNYTNDLKKVTITAGLRGEQTNASGNSLTLNQVTTRNYFDLFPQAQLIYKYNEKNDFSLSFNRGIERPLYSDINPFLYYVDVYDYRSGNPNLLPQYTNTLQLSHTYNKTFITTLYGLQTTGFDGFSDFEQNDATRVDITTRKNFGTYSIYGIKFFTPATFSSWWTADFLLDASYQRIKAYPENGNLNKGTQDIVFTSNQYFTIGSTTKASISGKYESPTFYGISQYKAAYFVNAGISQQLFGKKGSLKLTVNDIFNTIHDRASVQYQNLNIAIVDKYETRIGQLTFTYKFGKTSVKSIKHETANEDEQKRAAN